MFKIDGSDAMTDRKPTAALSRSSSVSPAPVASTPPARPAHAQWTDKDLVATVERLRAAFDSGTTRPIAWRRAQLHALVRLIEDNESAILDALREDLGKPRFEAFGSETGFVRADARHVLSNLAAWMRPRKVRAPLLVQPGSARLVPEPLGVVLIIAPWNYPIQLALSPLVGALAAGNCAIVKPSEVAPASSSLLARLVPRYLDPACVAVVEGEVRETTTLLAQRFDHVFYTGNGTVGRIVMRAAAEHLTPVTLELGGKSPCIVAADADLEIAARRIAWGKFFNAGQTCIAPDYLLVERSVERPLLERLGRVLRQFYGDDPRRSPDYGRIVSARHHARLARLLGDGELVIGGQVDADARYIAPTVLRDVRPDAPVMQEEIFGPILPVLAIDNVADAVRFVNERPKPLALYVFTRSDATARTVVERTSSGGACVNDCVSHIIPAELPFGGVGPSGIGAYHGKASFDTFTHHKSVLARSNWFDLTVRYPPYDDRKERLARRLL